MTAFSSERFPILFRDRWNRTGLAAAINNIDPDLLCAEYDKLRAQAPKRHASNKRYFVGHEGRLRATKPANPSEEHLAIALWRLKTLAPQSGVSAVRFLDYQLPLQAARSDAGIGKVDLLATTIDDRLVIVELKARLAETPIEALIQGLRYAAVVQANDAAIAAEARVRFGLRVADGPPIVQILAPDDWWRAWCEMAPRTRRAAGPWESCFHELAAGVETRLGIAIECGSLQDGGLADITWDTKGPMLPRPPSVSPTVFEGRPAPVPVVDYVGYEIALRENLWAWADQHLTDRLDGGGRSGRPPVLLPEAASMNVLVPSDPPRARYILDAVPVRERHRWFRSLKSSQALAQSVFGAVAASDRLDLLQDIVAECGRAAFLEHMHGVSLVLEHRVEELGEPRPTSVDVLLSSPTRRVAVECKFTEREYGTCSRPNLRPGDRTYAEQHCDGNYRVQRQRTERCALTEIGVRYWNHLPGLFHWEAGKDRIPCPLSPVYQLARNALAATVTGNGCDAASGHVLTVFDARNPDFAAGGAAWRQFEEAVAACRIPGLFRRVSWQRVARALSPAPEFAYLVTGLERKYGITTG